MRCTRLLAVLSVLLASAGSGCAVDSEGTGANVPSGTGGATWDGGSGTGGTAAQGGTSGTGGTDILEAGPDGSGGTSGTGGTGAGGTGGTSGASGTGGTGGTAGIGPEQCLDGIDNDQNGDTDCGDADCQVQGYLCAPPVPAGWSGYFRLGQQNASDPPPQKEACPDPSVTAERYLRDPAGDAQCLACSCGDLGGATCKVPPIECAYGNTSCTGATAKPEFETGCNDMPTGSMGSSHQVSCRLTGASVVANAGSCQPSAAPDFTNKLLFDLVVDACPFYFGSGAGCQGGTVCAEPGAGAYSGALCIQKPGNESICPTEFPTRFLVFRSAVEGRSCSACDCVPDVGSITCSGGNYKVWDNDGCGGCMTCIDDTYVDSTTCKDLTAWADLDRISIRAQPPPALGGACNPSGGDPLGAVVTDSPVTFCCLL